MQTPAFRSCHQRNQGLHNNRRGYPCYVSSCSLVPSHACDWNVNSKPLNMAASKPTEGSWQVGSKWSRQQENTDMFYALTLNIALQIFQSTHNLYRRPWLRCPDTWRMSMQSILYLHITLLSWRFWFWVLKDPFSQEKPQLTKCFFFLHAHGMFIKDSSVMVLWPKWPSSVQFMHMNSPHNLGWP